MRPPVPRVFVLLLACSLALALPAGTLVDPGAATTGADVVTLTVTVVTPTGEPVRDARLTASWSNGSVTARTASNGKAFLDVPAGADVRIEVDHPAYHRNFPFRVQHAIEESIRVRMVPTARARLTVADASGPVSGVVVRFWKDGLLVAKRATGPAGTVASGPIESGEYRVTLEAPGYVSRSVSLAIAGTTNETLSIERGTIRVVVAVTDDHFEPPRPVAGATVFVDGNRTGTTGENGTVAVPVPVNSRVRIEVTKDGYSSAAETLRTGERDRELAVTVRREPALTLELPSDRIVVGEPVVGTVTDAYGDPVANATVRLDGTPVGTTDSDGDFSVAILAAGSHSLTVERGDLASDPERVRGVDPAGTPARPSESPTATPSPDPTAGASPSPTRTDLPTTSRPSPTTTTPATGTGTTGIGSPGFGLWTAAVAGLLLLLALRGSRRNR